MLASSRDAFERSKRDVTNSTRGSLEHVVGRHALCMIDFMKTDGSNESVNTRLSAASLEWSHILKLRSGQLTRPADDYETDTELKYQHAIDVMVSGFIERMRANNFSGLTAQDRDRLFQFYRLFSPSAQRAWPKTVAKFELYLRYLRQLHEMGPSMSSSYYDCCIACVVTGMSVGAWLDMTL